VWGDPTGEGEGMKTYTLTLVVEDRVPVGSAGGTCMTNRSTNNLELDEHTYNEIMALLESKKEQQK
jgi:hypothetical protein